MSRPIGIIENQAALPFIDREALMMDGGRLFFQLTPEDSGGGDTAGSSAVGQTLFHPDGTLAGTLVLGRVPFGGGPRPMYLSIPATETKGAQIVPFRGGTFLVEAGGGKAFSLVLNSQGDIVKSGTVDLDTGGTGGSGTSFASTQAAQTQAEEFRREENRLDRAQTDRLEGLRADNARRLDAIGSLRSLAGQAAQIRTQFRTDLLGLEQASQVLVAQMEGVDPIRGAITGDLGLVQRGRTPAQAHQSNVRTLGEQAGAKAAELATPLQQPNFEADIGGLEAQIAQATEQLDPGDLPRLPTPPVFGLEHGGEVVKAGKDEPPVKPFSSRPDPMTAFQFADQMGLTPIIVGEREGGPELLLAAKGSKVIPLNDDEEGALVGRVQGAFHGADLGSSTSDNGFENFDFSTIEQSLSPIFESTGFAETPTFFRQPSGIMEITPGLKTTGEFATTGGIGAAKRLGTRPGLLHSEGTVYLVDPEGRLRPFPSFDIFEQSGFNLSQVLNVSPGELAGFERGPALTEPPPLIEPGVSKRRFPLSDPRTLEFPEGQKLFLPAARQLASIFRNLGADTRNVILSAFGVAGQSNESFLEELDFFTPTGTARAAGAAAFG